MIEPQTSEGWKVRLERPITTGRINVYLLRYSRGFVEIMQPEGLIIRLQEGAVTPPDLKPTFVLSGIESRSMMIALAEALDQEGIKTPEDLKIRGTLEAMKAHLADLRQLLKLK